MRYALIVPAARGIVTFGAPALTAAGATAQRYAALQCQLDTAIRSRESRAMADARMLRTDAAGLCGGGKTFDGIANVEQALNDLGVKSR
jgi:hypothetical protein